MLGFMGGMKDHLAADKDSTYNPMTSNRRLIQYHGYGIDSVFPPFDPGKSRKKFESELTRHSNLTGERWLRLNQLVLGSEKAIQDVIIKLSKGGFKDEKGKTLDIEHFLNISWEAARDEYNARHATDSGTLTSGFRLDPKGGMAPNRSTDLDVFSLVYLTCRPPEDASKNLPRERHYPVYRNGANYKGDTEIFWRALRDSSFDGLAKPLKLSKDQNKLKFNEGVEEFQENIRASFLVPHINVLDLTNTFNLLTFIHNRARFLPEEFLYKDYDAMYTGASTRILTGACDPTCSIEFKTQGKDNDRAFPIKPLFHYQHLGDKWEQDITRVGQPFYGMGGWLIMQSQAITCLFLTNFCEQMLQLAAKKQPVDDFLSSLTHQQILDMEIEAGKTIEAIRGDRQVETVDDIEAIRQYELTYEGTNFARYEELLTKQRHEAEQHVSILFDDPDYFARAIIEEKEHHWGNLYTGYDDLRLDQHVHDYYKRTSLRHKLYLECMRAVLRRAFFEFFIWDAVWHALKDLKRYEDEKFKGLSRVEYIRNGKRRITWRSQISSDDDCEYLERHRVVQSLLRQAAAFFVFEFRKNAIHAASPSMRDTYCIPNADKKPADLADSFYTAPNIELQFLQQASNEERSQIPRIVLELIENFISNRTSSMFVGMRKTTSRILRYFEECESDEETSAKFSNLVRGNIKGLNILSEIVDHMDHHMPDAMHLFHQIGDETKGIGRVDDTLCKQFTEALMQQNSYDLLALDGCAFETKHVPQKRMSRIYDFLDEIQGIGHRKEDSFAAARGDIKRFGSSLLKGLIFPLARKDRDLDYTLRFGNGFTVSQEALDRLTRHMRITEDQWPFVADEKPWYNLDQADAANPQHYKGIWKDLKEAMKKLSKKNEKKLKKPGKTNSRPLNQYDFVADEVKLARTMADISKRQMQDCVTKRIKKKKTIDRRLRQQEEARQRRLAAQDAINQSVAPDVVLPPVAQDETGNVEELVQAMDIDQEAEPEPEEETPPVVPDHDLRIPLKKGCWETLDAIVSDNPENKPRITYHNLAKALDAIGFEPKTKSGSHVTYGYQRGFPPFPDVTGLTIVKPHGSIGENANVPPPILRDWRHYIRERGLTLEKVEERYSR
ncbi:hypothetical protein FPOA_06096 [Fusarium poae]|uniref:Uncharacterized protein n=1 Tax=Fusarium poae TaxID=36050 RepID=A0A1B8AYV3_FUSPO|nr:hypothetical protein FPOA_06096 [Fusarium poae]